MVARMATNSFFCINSNRYHQWWLLLVLLLPLSVQAGGFFLKDARVNGLDKEVTVKPNERVTVCYRQLGYFYSGHGDEYSHLLFSVVPQIDINQSVGAGGVNDPKDVEKVINAMQQANLLDNTVTAQNTETLNRAIAAFQLTLGSQNPDARIDPWGRTMRALQCELKERLLAKLHKRRLTGETEDPGEYSLKNCITFIAPSTPGSYLVDYQGFPYITQYPLSVDENNELSDKHQQEVLRKLRAEPYRSWNGLAVFAVKAEPVNDQRNLATYLRINDKFLAVVENIKPGDHPKPVNFSWHTKPPFADVEFRYRLYPDQPDFSTWSKRKAIDYFFIGAGSHTFEVQTRYPTSGDKYVILPIADYNFFLEHPFISKPVVYKASGAQIEAGAEAPDLRNLYTKSKALLVGVTGFEKMSLLPYVDKDVEKMDKALQQYGFQTTKLVGKITRDQLIEGLERSLTGLEINDRVIIYFSTHGFQDKQVKTRGYVAPYDCDPDLPGLHCLELESLERRIERALTTKVKHLLVILDTCSSGLGVVAKSPEYQELTIATEPGAHMITAGMGEQKAEMDNVEQISTFTRFLAEGLAGKADYTKDGVVSLTELLLYVRYQVAQKTNGSQTPMIGRLDGTGEMIFQLNR
jgi:hypothetical protein